MARTPLLQLTDIALTFGGDPVFSDLSLAILELDLAGRIEIRPGGMISRLYDET